MSTCARGTSWKNITAPSRVVFGSGKLQTLPDEMARQDLCAPVILTTPQQIDQGEMVQVVLGGVGNLFTEATMHTPTSITDRAVAYTTSIFADSIISIGGGSTIGLGKAIKMTPVLGESVDGIKRTRIDPKILPGTVIYDADLTLSLPTGPSATSGMNANAHAVEALYAQNANAIISLLDLEGMKALAACLPVIADSPSDPTARSTAQYGAWLCGLCLGSVGMALHHKLCHTLGGSFSLPHAETHTIVLPHALAYNAPPGGFASRQQWRWYPWTQCLIERLKVQRGFKYYGLKEEDIDKAADIAVSNPNYNPRTIERDLLRELIRRAYSGEDPRID
ncbi:hypothetical protein EDB80DRAFT_817152 [Ilyonectria destructans]|nr:hypothetical protein EDB80DRAFT_817152 [Ilyonectria destructans]